MNGRAKLPHSNRLGHHCNGTASTSPAGLSAERVAYTSTAANAMPPAATTTTQTAIASRGPHASARRKTRSCTSVTVMSNRNISTATALARPIRALSKAVL